MSTATLIRLTDHKGRLTVPLIDLSEPEPASVVLTEGEYGTAWQRHFADGLWHASRGGGARPWAWLVARRNLFLIYDAPARED